MPKTATINPGGGTGCITGDGGTTVITPDGISENSEDDLGGVHGRTRNDRIGQAFCTDDDQGYHTIGARR